MLRRNSVIGMNRIVNSGDAFGQAGNPSLRTDEILLEISRLYLERCKALWENNTAAIELFTHKIDYLKFKLDQI
jgi:hypothetical protein